MIRSLPAILVLGMLVACRGQGGPSLVSTIDRQKLDGAVLRMEFRHGGLGSAVALPDGRYLTCLHNFPEWLRTSPENTIGHCTLDGTAVRFRIVGHGGTTSTPEGDWAIIELVDGDLRPRQTLAFSCSRVPRDGTTVYLVGNWSPSNYQGPFPVIVSGRIVEQVPESFDFGESVIFIDTDYGGTHRGHSGGAVVVLHDNGELGLLGLYRGSAQASVLGRKTDVLQLARLIPAQAR